MEFGIRSVGTSIRPVGVGPCALACCVRTAVFLATAASVGAGAADESFEIRLDDTPPVRLPVHGFSVRQMNAVNVNGRYWAYVDVVPWDSPFHPNTYSTSVHAYESADGRSWDYRGEVLPRGGTGAWDAGGVATPTACVTGGRILVAYSGRGRPDGAGPRSIGLAAATTPSGPFVRRTDPIVSETGQLDDPILVAVPGEEGRVLLYYRRADPRGRYTVSLCESRDGGRTWTPPEVVLRATGDVRAIEPLDGKWIGGRLVFAQVEHFQKGGMKTALYVSPDGRIFSPCRRKYLNDWLRVPVRFAFGPILTFVPDADGAVRTIGLCGFMDGAGHYTHWFFSTVP